MPWERPVQFFDKDTGERQEVTDPLHALQFLNRWWRKEDGDPYYTAIVTCIDAARDEAPVEDARRAFQAALTAGGVRVLPTQKTPS